ncbi:MAG: ATP-binding cassette domain-containing protein, partial [Bacillales bacterium]|nr:ATP-binding cassette domain-containing protein [Bacillales bacterium]
MKISHLSKKVGDKTILNDISCDFSLTGIVSLFGPSGAGKSSLLYAIAGLDKSVTGSIIIEQQEITKLSNIERNEFLKEKIAFIFQDNQLIPFLNIQDNLLINRSYVIDEKYYSLLNIKN